MKSSGKAPIGIAVHGGAGVIDRTQMTPDREAAYRNGLSSALDGGYAVLEQGGTSVDAVVEAVRLLEDDPHFNAGRGAVLSHDGVAELDASIMDGKGPRAGSVAGLRHVMNPIELARLTMDVSSHVMLIGTGAEEFALERGLVLVPNSYFRTQYREQELQRALLKERHGLAASSVNDLHFGEIKSPASGITGTVGAVALDSSGNLAAATSTGGMTNKRYGRVGDSPIIGAGTYANNDSCAVSATGSGEYFIRSVVAHDIHALMLYKNVSVAEAAREVVHEKLKRLGGDGGVIAIDRAGRIVMEFNSEGMFRGARDSQGRRELAIYKDGLP